MDIERRTVLQASGVLAVGGLVAACSSGGSTAAASSGVAAPSQGAAATAGAAPSGTIASVADIPVGGGVIISDPAVVVTQPAAGEIKAFTAICTHQGCLVAEVADNEISCPCHGSRFSAKDGSVLQGPATTPLAAEAVTVEGGNVVLG
jgi:Rieske Fe-S protein